MKKRVGTPVFAFFRLAIAVAGCFCLGPVYANPVGGVVVPGGSATFATQGKTLTITNTPGAIINWQGFSIGAGETTRFTQASAASAVLNRVVTNNPSQLFGQLQSNGRVFLINPAGILVGAGAVVDTAGFVASTLNLSNADFLAGRLNFTATPGAGKVENYGTISTPSGGSVYLVGAQVDNHGIINAPNGEVLLAAGKTAQLIDTGTPGVRVELTADTEQALNVGQILAESGRVGMVGAIVRNSGRISASSVTSEGGRVFLKATADAYVEQAGRIDATGTTGGTVEVLGKRVALLDAASIDVSGANGGGTILIGGDYQGKNSEVQNATISYVGDNVSLKADATLVGNGGKVIVWADDTTRFYGDISARGGAQSGNGGFVEVSGKRCLDFQGMVSTAAAKGKVGTLLLDPSDITIGGSGSDSAISSNTTGDPWVYQATGDPSTLSVGTLVSALGNNNVLVDAAGGSGSDTVGDITVDSAVGWNSANKLTLKSSGEGGIAINAPITAQDGALKLDAGTGGISQNEAGVIATKTLEVVSEGRVTLEAGNQVGTLAANVKGSEQPFSFANKNKDLAIGTVGGTHGVSTSTYGDVIISVLETGDLTSVEGASISGETITLLTSDAASKIAADGDIIGGTGGVSLTAGKITGTGAVTSAGDLTMTTTNGEINQGKLTVTGNGATTFNAGTGDITLTNLQNSFGGFVNAIGGAISIQAAALNFGTFSNGANKAVDLRTKHGNLTLSGIIDTGTADLTLTSAGTLTTAGNLAGANVSLTGVAGLTLKHNVNAAHDLTLSSGTGVIGQTAGAMTVGGALTANAASGIYLSQSGNSAASVNLVNTASNAVDYKGTGASSSVTISGSNSGGGAFSVNIDKNINLGLISNPGGTVSLTSTDGAIHDGNGSSNNISAATATLSAKKGIGQGDAIEMTVSTVSASNSSNGDIQLDNTGALLTDGVSTGTGNVSIVTHSPMTIGGSGVSASGDIALTVGGTGAGDTLTLSGPVYSSNGNIVLTAGSTITGDNHALGVWAAEDKFLSATKGVGALRMNGRQLPPL